MEPAQGQGPPSVLAPPEGLPSCAVVMLENKVMLSLESGYSECFRVLKNFVEEAKKKQGTG